jgi:hypothetical protein
LIQPSVFVKYYTIGRYWFMQKRVTIFCFERYPRVLFDNFDGPRSGWRYIFFWIGARYAYGNFNKMDANFLVLAGSAEIASGQGGSDDAHSANDAYDDSPIAPLAQSSMQVTYHTLP